MDRFPGQKSLSEQVEYKLQEKVSYAKSHCLTIEEEAEINEKLIEGMVIQRERELTNDEVEYYYLFRERLDEASITVDTLPEARRIMEMIGFSNDSLIDTLSHENAHANKAMQLGANFGGYKFLIIKDVDGGYLVNPMAETSIPEDWSDEKREEVDTKIIGAPYEYGNRMSDGDRKELRIKYGK